MIIEVGTVFQTTRSGYATVIDKSARGWLVRFNDTGFTKALVRNDHIERGGVFDPMLPRIRGVGFIGVGVYGVSHQAYKRWSRMMERCYSEKYHAKKPTYKDCVVCPEWHNFQKFAAWFEEHYPTDGASYHLDKDAIDVGNKLYSPDTCVFLSASDNALVRWNNTVKKTFTAIAPNGSTYQSDHASNFAKEHGLRRSCITGVLSGRRKTTNGWSFSYN